MSSESKSSSQEVAVPKSGFYQRPRQLPLVEDIRHVSPELLNRVRRAVISARRKIEGLIANDDGQGMLFPDLADEINIPENEVDEVIRTAELQLSGTGIGLEKGQDSVRVIARTEHEDPQEAIGYGR